METLWQDVQFAVRMMRKNLGFTTAAVLCLMLGNWSHPQGFSPS